MRSALLAGTRGDVQRHYVAGPLAKTACLSMRWCTGLKANFLIIEFEPASASVVRGLDTYASLTTAIDELGAVYSLTDLCKRVAARVRSITGFDRVMVYRFLEDGTGCKSKAKTGRDRTSSLILGCVIPHRSIPAQKPRRLYLSGIRSVWKSDVNAAVATLVPSVNPFTGTVLDMTYCIFRAMSPVHVEYLRNMGA